jgi:predicted Zn-dependent protease
MKPLATLTLALAVVFALPVAQADFNLGDVLKTLAPPPPPSQPPAQGNAAGTAESPQPSGAELAINLFGKVNFEEEQRIGAQIAGNLLGAAPLVKDAALQAYVNKVGRWVAMQTERANQPWHFGVIESDAVNAYAAPGNYVFVTRGLYQRLSTEAELAGVLGHEIGHVIKRHHINLMKKTQLLGALTQQVTKRVSKEGGDGVAQNVIGNGAEILARGLDKDAEYEADRMGVVYTARAGYDVWGLPTVLQDLATLAPGDSRIAALYKTHPTAGDRLEHLGDAIGERFDNLPPGRDLEKRFYRLK